MVRFSFDEFFFKKNPFCWTAQTLTIYKIITYYYWYTPFNFVTNLVRRTYEFSNKLT